MTWWIFFSRSLTGAMPPKKKRKVTPKELVVRLKETCPILPNLRLLEVSNVQFIQNNGSNASYLYYITELILGCPVKLYRQMDGQDAPDDDAGWKFISRSTRDYFWSVCC